MATASTNEVAELLGDRADEALVERVASVGASLDEIAEAIEDLHFQREYGEDREPSSPKVDEIRMILEDYFEPDHDASPSDDDGDDDGLTIVDAEELGREPQ
jgi:hypothetical protein